MTGGTLTTTSTADESQIVKLMQGGGTLAGANAVVLTGSGANASSWIGGTMSGAGTTRVASGAALNISGSAAVSLADGRTLDMRGTVTWSGTVLILQAGSPASVLTVGPGGLFDITGNSTTYVQLRVLPGGTLRKSGASGTTQIGTSLKNGGRIEVLSGFLVVSGLFRNFSGNALVGGEYLVQGTFRFLGANIVTNAADVTLDGPSAAIEDPGGSDAFANLARNARGGSLAFIGGRDLTVAGPFTNSGTLVASSGSTFAVANNAFTNSFGGVLQGTGNVDANVTSAGEVAPGLSRGILTIDGFYSQQNNGRLRVELTGTVPGTEYDRLVVTGSAALGGRLIIESAPGFEPPLGTTFEILSGSRSGQFPFIEGAQLPSGHRYVPHYNPTSVQLVVQRGLSPKR